MLLRYIYVLAFICIFFVLQCKAQQVQWLRPINGYDNTDIVPQSLYADNNGSLYVITCVIDTFIIGKDTIIPDSASNLTAITQYDSSGKVLSIVQIKKPGFYFDVRAIVTDELKNIYCAGQYKSSRESNMLMKCDSTGKIIWMRSAKGNVAGQGISLDKNGNLYVTGYIYDSFLVDTFVFKPKHMVWNSFISKFDTSGKVKWVNFFYNKNGDMAHTHGNLIGNNGQLYVVGHMKGLASIDSFQALSGPSTAVLMSLDTSNGHANFLIVDSPGTFQKFYIYQDRWGNILTSGDGINTKPSVFNFKGERLNYYDDISRHIINGGYETFGMNRQGQVLTAFDDIRNNHNTRLLLTDESGKTLSNFDLGLKNASVNRIIPDQHNQFYIYGSWRDTFAYKGDTVLRVSKNYKKITGQFVGRITGASYAGIAGEAKAKALQFDIYPNPTSGLLMVLAPGIKEGQISLYDLTGQVHYYGIISESAELQLHTLPKGLYLLKLQSKNGMIIKQVILQ